MYLLARAVSRNHGRPRERAGKPSGRALPGPAMATK